MLHLDRCHVEQHVALSHLMAEWRVTWAADGNALQIASRVRRRAAPSRRASACRESACRAVCACRARRWCAAAPATTDRNARAGPCRMLGPGAQRRPPVIVYTCFEKSSRSPYCTREPRRRAHCVILIYIITRLLRTPDPSVSPPRPHTVHTIKGFTALSYIAHHALLRHAHSTSLVSCHVPVAQKHTRGSSHHARSRTDRTLSRMSTGEHARRPSAPHPRAPHMPDDTEPLA